MQERCLTALLHLLDPIPETLFQDVVAQVKEAMVLEGWQDVPSGHSVVESQTFGSGLGGVGGGVGPGGVGFGAGGLGVVLVGYEACMAIPHCPAEFCTPRIRRM